MADFETRIDDLTGFGSNTDRNAIDDWLMQVVVRCSTFYH